MSKKYLIFFGAGLVFFGAIIRLIPHAPNFTPITAIALLASWHLGKRWGLLLPILAMLVSDSYIGFYTWQIMLSVYVSFAVVGMIGWIAAKYRSVFALGFATISSSVLFFVMTNAAVWWFSPWYSKTFAGLMYSYELGLPFFRNMLSGDIIYTASLFCAFELVINYKQIINSKIWTTKKLWWGSIS